MHGQPHIRFRETLLFEKVWDVDLQLLRRLTYSRKGPISFVFAVRVYQRGFHCTDLHRIWCWGGRILWKYVQEIPFWLESDNNSGCFTWRPISSLWSSLPQFFLDREVFQTNVVENIKAHTFCVQQCPPPIFVLFVSEFVNSTPCNVAFALYEWLRKCATLIHPKGLHTL